MSHEFAYPGRPVRRLTLRGRRAAERPAQSTMCRTARSSSGFPLRRFAARIGRRPTPRLHIQNAPYLHGSEYARHQQSAGQGTTFRTLRPCCRPSARTRACRRRDPATASAASPHPAGTSAASALVGSLDEQRIEDVADATSCKQPAVQQERSS